MKSAIKNKRTIIYSSYDIRHSVTEDATIRLLFVDRNSEDNIKLTLDKEEAERLRCQLDSFLNSLLNPSTP